MIISANTREDMNKETLDQID